MKKLSVFLSLNLMIIFGVVCFAMLAHADAPSALPSHLPALDPVEKALELSSATKAMLTMALAFIFEMLVRVFKTSKPLSIAWLIAGTMKALAALMIQLARIVQKAAEMLDAILPQNAVEPAPVLVQSIVMEKAIEKATLG